MTDDHIAAGKMAPASPAADELTLKWHTEYCEPAPPSPGLREAVTLSKACPCAKHSVELTVPSWPRDAVIEACAKLADMCATGQTAAAAIRALSRPVSEREAET